VSSISKTAGIIIIGNEVLSGKTRDSNSYFLTTELRALGVEVKKISVIPDEIDLIGRETAEFSRRFDYVFTTGGVGPTHDDVTMAGIAKGLGVRVIRHPALERLLKERYGRSLNDARLRMADVPEGAELLGEASLYGHVIKAGNVHIFPGIPKILEDRFRAIRENFREAPYFLKAIYLNESEGAIAATLNDLLANFPELLLGSYPVIDTPDYKVKVTLESKDRVYLDRACAKLLGALPNNIVHRVEGN
jgi:molybdenum cofactor synthesis domain-containing protein